MTNIIKLYWYKYTLGETMEKNERKLQVLKILCNGGITSSELAGTYGLHPTTASCLLANYHHQGLLRRKLRKEPGGAPRGEYYYTIAGKGERKIEYLGEVFQPTFVEEAGAGAAFRRISGPSFFVLPGARILSLLDCPLCWLHSRLIPSPDGSATSLGSSP
ncbi:hypothetical protein ES708_31266 [subsurface metagenome]